MNYFFPMSENRESIGDRVELLRRARGWRQAELAQRMTALGVKWHTSTVSKVEKDERVLRPEELVAIGTIYGVTVDELLTGLKPEDASAVLREFEWVVWHGDMLIALMNVVTVMNAMPLNPPEDRVISAGVLHQASEVRRVVDGLDALASGGWS